MDLKTIKTNGNYVLRITETLPRGARGVFSENMNLSLNYEGAIIPLNIKSSEGESRVAIGFQETPTPETIYISKKVLEKTGIKLTKGEIYSINKKDIKKPTNLTLDDHHLLRLTPRQELSDKIITAFTEENNEPQESERVCYNSNQVEQMYANLLAI